MLVFDGEFVMLNIIKINCIKLALNLLLSLNFFRIVND